MKAKVYNLIILDKSGSMSSIRNAAIGGFNETIGGIRSAQKQFAETQEHFVSLLTFCNCNKSYVYDCVPVDEVKKLTTRDYQPCCGTPLYDAMGMGINDMIRKTKDEENATVMVTIITDGMENASKEYSGSAIKALVEQMQNEKGWNFAYIGTNQDVTAVAHDLSINNTMFFEDDERGMREAWEKERKARQRMYSRVNLCMEDACLCMETDNAPSFSFVNAMKGIFKSKKNYQEMSEFAHRVTPDHITYLKPGQIFVFGSNPEGAHTGGASLTALKQFGAIMGQGEGLQGQSYAIPTTHGMIQMHIERFILFAKAHPELTFLVTRVGCGVAGHSVGEIAPLFVGAVDVENIWLPKEFWSELI